jgi:membrane-associated HD superfamily phosphohydrolase
MNQNTDVICPACQKTFESVFALEGHLRLTMDPEHIAFRQQLSETVSDTAVPAAPMIPHFAGGKLIDVLETYVKDQENLYGQEAKANAMFKQLKDMLEGERKIEKKYEQLIDSEDAELEQARQTVREEIYKQYQQDIAKAVAQAIENLQQQHQKDMDAARAERNKEEYSKGYLAAVLYIPNPLDGQTILVQIGSPLHAYINKLVEAAWVSHPEDCRRVYNQQRLFYMEQQLRRKPTE